jgi:beta-galactosidase
MRILASVFYLVLLILSGPRLKAQADQRSVKFNKDWKFIGVESADDKQTIDSTRRLGKNWNDQFLIEKVNENDTSLLPQYLSLKEALSFTEGHKWTPVTLPHIAFPEPLVIVKPREGVAYYKKAFHLPSSFKGKRISIEFEGAMQVATIWFNGQFMVQHQGGYLPFTIDITRLAKLGSENIIIVKLDNRPSPLVPPGKPVNKLDFIYYSGIYRDVWLHIMAPLHITDASVARKRAGGGIFVSYENVSARNATVNIQTHIINEDKQGQHFSVIQQITNKQGKVVGEKQAKALFLKAGEDRHFTVSLPVAFPILWHPDSPYLYSLHTIVRKNKQLVDSVLTRIGIRSFTITKEKGLLINGKPFHLSGSNRHMSYPWIGNALSDNANYRDADIIKSAGMNCIRLAHYPQDPSFYDACDELGILLIDCIPGWQFFNQSPAFGERVMDDIRQIIRRDRNHPSVLLWEMSLNETYPSAEFRCMQNEVAKSEWPFPGNFYTSVKLMVLWRNICRFAKTL